MSSASVGLFECAEDVWVIWVHIKVIRAIGLVGFIGYLREFSGL